MAHSHGWHITEMVRSWIFICHAKQPLKFSRALAIMERTIINGWRKYFLDRCEIFYCQALFYPTKAYFRTSLSNLIKISPKQGCLTRLQNIYQASILYNLLAKSCREIGLVRQDFFIKYLILSLWTSSFPKSIPSVPICMC